MATRPSMYPYWTDGDPAKITQPPADVLLMGWTGGQPPPFQWWNWWNYTVEQWIEYLDSFTEDAVPENSYRLINGGIWGFVAGTGVLSWSATANLAVPGTPDASNSFAAGSVTLADGDIAYLTPNTPFNTKADSESGSNVLSSAAYTGNIQTGMVVTGPGIPNGTTVTGKTPDTILLSANATSNNTQGTYIFVNTGPLTISTGANNSTLLTPQQVLLARRSGNVVFLGVNASQMTLRDQEFKALIGSGYFALYQALAGQNLTAGQIVYISEGESGRTQGDAYPLDCSSTFSPTRAVYAGLVITSVNSGQTATILYSGFYPEVGLTPGTVYYADPTTPGGITNIPPSGAGQKIVPVGFAVTSTSLLLTGAQGGGSMSFPVFYDEIAGYGNGTQTDFPLAQEPLSSVAVFVFKNGQIVPDTEWSLNGIQTIRFNTAPAVGQQIYVQYVLAEQSYVGAFQEVPQPHNGSTTVFDLSGNPINQMSMFVWIDGRILPRTMWSLTFGNPCQIVLNNALAPGQKIYTGYFTPATAWGGAVLGAQNIGGGGDALPVYAGIQSGILQFNSLNPGTNITMALVDGQLTINSVAGSIGAPIRQVYAPGGTITGVINGTNRIFTLPDAIPYPETLLVFVNGSAQINGIHYALSGAGNNIITFATAPAIGQNVLAQYNTT